MEKGDPDFAICYSVLWPFRVINRLSDSHYCDYEGSHWDQDVVVVVLALRLALKRFQDDMSGKAWEMLHRA